MADLRYFMNVRYRGRLAPDYEGDELANAKALHKHALAIARDLVFRTRMDTIRSWFDCSFEITDETGKVVLVMRFAEVLPKFAAGSA
ncbi:hypothetical protein CN311_07670 [Mesorhizobium sanjuanii]|uniref:DUF6894 domain-containing protein n=1 Tax=Mesorhizobium sanjuanii TaxID=2037900 RepID=A0A2A6FIP1_9HYPH|nr:hypothetical protein [Mesorhizobium sanjuanii]PDQ21694.1 hypothetical protein CN311_07670 [Mesorhizobium sanjuanii]